MDKRTPSLRGEILEADTTGPAVARVGTIQLNWVSSAYLPKRDQFAFRRPNSSVLLVIVGRQTKAMGDPTVAGGARAQGAGRLHSACWGSHRGGDRTGGGLNPEVKVTIGGDRPPRLGGDVVTFEAMLEFLVTYSEQRPRITHEDGGDRVLTGRRELQRPKYWWLMNYTMASPGSTSPRRS